MQSTLLGTRCVPKEKKMCTHQVPDKELCTRCYKGSLASVTNFMVYTDFGVTVMLENIVYYAIRHLNFL